MHGLYSQPWVSGQVDHMCAYCGHPARYDEQVCTTCAAIIADTVNDHTATVEDKYNDLVDDDLIEDYLATFVCGQHFACMTCEDTLTCSRAACPYVRVFYAKDVDVTGP